MGIAERIYEIVKDLPEASATEVLDYAESKRGAPAGVSTPAARRARALAVLDRYAGRFKAVKFDRAELYDRASLCR